jgi:hypothetical protein
VKPADTHTSRDVAALLGEKRNAPEADIAVAGAPRTSTTRFSRTRTGGPVISSVSTSNGAATSAPSRKKIR